MPNVSRQDAARRVLIVDSVERLLGMDVGGDGPCGYAKAGHMDENGVIVWSTVSNTGVEITVTMKAPGFLKTN